MEAGGSSFSLTVGLWQDLANPGWRPESCRIGAPVLLMELRPSHPELTHCAYLPGGTAQAWGSLDWLCQTLGTSNTGPQRTVAHPQNYLCFSIHDTVIVIVIEVKFIDHTFTFLEYTIQGFSTHLL